MGWLNIGEVTPGPPGPGGTTGPGDEGSSTRTSVLTKKQIANLAAGGLVVAVIGWYTIGSVLMDQGWIVDKSMSKNKLAVRAAAVGGLVAVPTVAYYMGRHDELRT